MALKKSLEKPEPERPGALGPDHEVRARNARA